MMGFRYRPGLGVPYERQGLVYFTSRCYKDQPQRVRKKIDRLCRECGGDHADALRAFVTTDTEMSVICRKFFLSKSTLYRVVRRYYREF